MKTRFAVVMAVLLSLLAPPAAVAAPSDSVLDTSAIYALLDVIDAIMEAHPDYASERARIDGLDANARAAALAEKRDANARNEAVTSRIDALLSTTAYQLYFVQYRFTKPETHRDILLALPYQAARGPSDVSDNLIELCRHRQAVRVWADGTLARIDPAACVVRAAEWLPTGNYHAPTVRFIYDGNGDAFSSFGGIVFDVFSIVFRFRSAQTRFENLDGVGTERMERVIAHEYHHALVRPLGLKSSLVPTTNKREQRVAAGIVREGVALLCDLEPGTRRDAMEDEATIAWWVAALNEKLSGTAARTLTDADWDEWLQSTYSDLAMDRLRDYFSRTRPGDDPDALARANAASRPMLVYTLGWFMINRIKDTPGGMERVLALLGSPHRVLAEYNRTLGESESHLRIITAFE